MNTLTVLAVAVFCSVVYAQPRPERDNTIGSCRDKVADVFFILDSSTSIYIEDYKQVLQFVSQVVTRFDVSLDDTRIGALSFSDDVKLGFDIDRFRTKGEVLASIDQVNLPYKTGLTNTHLAIRSVRETQRFREDITKVMVVITDGSSRVPEETRREADIAREQGFHMVVVGVGQYTDEAEWRAIASDPDNDYLFNITAFRALETLRDVLPMRICNMQPIPIASECTVNEDADLFLLSAPNGYNDALDLGQRLADATRAGNRLHARYIMDICRNQTDFYFQGPDGRDRFCNRFGDAVPQDENTYGNLLRQLTAAASRMRQTRPAANQVAVLFLDDQAMRGPSGLSFVQQLRSLKVRESVSLIVVDLGVRENFYYVTSLVDREDIISYATLSQARSTKQLVDRLCVGVNSPIFGSVVPSK